MYDLHPGFQIPTSNHKWSMKQAVERVVADTDAERLRKVAHPIRRTRSGAWLQTMGNLWAPLAMCIAAQDNCKVVKTKCPNIFIHTMCFLYRCMVCNVHKIGLFLYHSFWVTLYTYTHI